MKQTNMKVLLVGAALIATAACTKKQPPLPPPPPQDNSTPAPPSTGPVGNTVVPGSAEDFRQQVGQSDTIYFDTDGYDLDSEDRASLDRQAQWLRQYPNVRVTIEGHCDERGTREYNLALGDRRANAAKNYLASQGIDNARLATISYGKERPAAMGSDEASWAQNRRAVTVVPSGM